MPDPSEDIRILTIEDVNQVVNIHLRSFPNFFLSFLGTRFLSFYYSAFCTGPEGIALVYLNLDGVPVGFVVGSSNPRGFYSRLLKKEWFNFAVAAIVPTLKKPSIIMRLARAVLHPATNPIGEKVAGLFSIGVLPELQNCGAGKLLVRAFLEKANLRECKKVFLSTDGDGNDSVNRFYASLGFTLGRQYVTHEGRRMNEYWITLPLSAS